MKLENVGNQKKQDIRNSRKSEKGGNLENVENQEKQVFYSFNCKT